MSSQVTFGRGGATKLSEAELCAALPASRAAKSTQQHASVGKDGQQHVLQGDPATFRRLETEGGWKLFDFCQEKVSNISSLGFFRQFCWGLFVFEAENGFLNHPRQTNKEGHHTD